MDQQQARLLAERWIASFESALTRNDENTLKELFAEVSYLRDNGAITWDFRQFHSRDVVISTLLSVNKEIQPRNFCLSPHWPEPRILEDSAVSTVVEAFIEFETAHGYAVAILNATPDALPPKELRATALFTRLEDLKNINRPDVYPRGNGFRPSYDGKTWKHHQDRKNQYIDSEPEVLIVGSGQAGLMVAAHLEQLGVSPLIIDKNERVGDNWYKRYDSLQTGQRGLWFNGGGINQVRPGSKRLALLVKADIDGLITSNFRRPPKASRK